MTFRSIQRLLVCLLVFAFVRALSTGRAAAQADGAAPVSAEYSRVIDEALEEYRLSHYEEARSLFERAHAIEPSARTLRGLGMVEFELRHYVRAAELLDEALKSQHRPLTAEQRDAVERLLARTRLFIGEYKLSVRPEPIQLSIEVDGKPVSLSEDRRVALEAGEHTLRISAPNAEPTVLKLDAKGGAAQTLQVTLVLKSEPAHQPAARAEPERPTRSPWGPALVATGAGVGLVGGALGLTALLKADSAVEHTAQGDQAHRMAVAADVLIGVGVATAVVGLVLWLKRPRADRAQHARLERVGLTGVRF